MNDCRFSNDEWIWGSNDVKEYKDRLVLPKLDVFEKWCKESMEDLYKMCGEVDFLRIVHDTYYAYERGFYKIETKYGKDVACVKRKVHNLTCNYLDGRTVKLVMEDATMKRGASFVSLDEAFGIADDSVDIEAEVDASMGAGDGGFDIMDVPEEKMRDLVYACKTGHEVRRLRIEFEKFLATSDGVVPEDKIEHVKKLLAALDSFYAEWKGENSKKRRREIYEKTGK